MNIRLIFLPLLFLIFSKNQAQSGNTFRDTVYSIFINGKYEVKTQDLKFANLNAMAIRDEGSQFKYALTIIHSHADEDYSNILSADYESSYLENCFYDILTKDQIFFQEVS